MSMKQRMTLLALLAVFFSIVGYAVLGRGGKAETPVVERLFSGLEESSLNYQEFLSHRDEVIDLLHETGDLNRAQLAELADMDAEINNLLCRIEELEASERPIVYDIPSEWLEEVAPDVEVAPAAAEENVKVLYL